MSVTPLPSWSVWRGCILPVWVRVVWASELHGVQLRAYAWLDRGEPCGELRLRLDWSSDSAFLIVKELRLAGCDSLPALWAWADDVVGRWSDCNMPLTEYLDAPLTWPGDQSVDEAA